MLFKHIPPRNLILILLTPIIVCGFVLPSFCCWPPSFDPSFAKATADTSAEAMTGKVEMPKDFDEAGGFAIQIVRELPDAMRESWGEAKEIWRKTWVKWWVEKIGPYLQESWGKVKVLLDKQIERAKTLLSGKYFDTMDQQGSIFRQEFEKEKQEMISELSKYTKPIIDKIKGMFSFRSFWDNLVNKLRFW